jgi:hypothetical protein
MKKLNIDLKLVAVIIYKMEAKKRGANQYSKCKKGYHWNKRAKKYIASVQIDEEPIILGAFDTEDDAREAYFAAIEKFLLPP